MRFLRRLSLGILLLGALAVPSFAADKPARVGLDWAYYNPVSLVLKKHGWVEEEFAKDGVAVLWVQRPPRTMAIFG